jgi:hypothetical protein
MNIPCLKGETWGTRNSMDGAPGLFCWNGLFWLRVRCFRGLNPCVNCVLLG